MPVATAASRDLPITGSADDEQVIPEIEATTPSQELMEVKFGMVPKSLIGLAVRKDGREACECIFLAKEGGVAYRLLDKTAAEKPPFRFSRPKDFHNNYDVSFDVTEDMKSLQETVGIYRSAIALMGKVMGGKSKNRLANSMRKSAFNKDGSLNLDSIIGTS